MVTQVTPHCFSCIMEYTFNPPPNFNKCLGCTANVSFGIACILTVLHTFEQSHDQVARFSNVICGGANYEQKVALQKTLKCPRLPICPVP